jgi:hypothetical protein
MKHLPTADLTDEPDTTYEDPDEEDLDYEDEDPEEEGPDDEELVGVD